MATATMNAPLESILESSDHSIHKSFLEGAGYAAVKPLQYMAVTAGMAFIGYVIGDVAPAVVTYALNSIGNGIGDSLSGVGPYFSQANVSSGFGMTGALNKLSLGAVHNFSEALALLPATAFVAEYVARPLAAGIGKGLSHMYAK